MHVKKAVVFILCAAIGFFATASVRGAQKRSTAATQTAARVEELQKALSEKSGEAEALSARLSEKTAELESYRSEAAKSGDAAAALTDKLRSVELWSGVSAAVGEGVVIKIADSKKSVGDEGIVHDDDIRKIVNELRVAGAEAIEVSGERITAQSGIRCVGSVILINNARRTSPFEIRAIGNSATLSGAINMTGGVADVLRSVYGISVEVNEAGRVEVCPYSGTISPEYMTIKGGEGE